MWQSWGINLFYLSFSYINSKDQYANGGVWKHKHNKYIKKSYNNF